MPTPGSTVSSSIVQANVPPRQRLKKAWWRLRGVGEHDFPMDGGAATFQDGQYSSTNGTHLNQATFF
jgi:hypothetical protein